MTSLSKPIFIETDVKEVEAGWVSVLEDKLQKKLQPGHPERAIASSGAYRESLIRQKIQDACVQNLVAFATAPVLDYLGDLVGVTRLPAAPALCTILFTLIEDHGGVTIPAGTRVASLTGVAAFATLEDIEVAAEDLTVEIVCECVSVGELGNGYLAGEISVIIDPQSFIDSAANVAETAGGTDEETDEQLRDRIKLAPASFSSAGPEDAYKFWAKTAHASIIDVETTSPEPGKVNVYPLVKGGGVTSDEILDAVSLTLNQKFIRPMTDTVEVLAPERIEYELEIGLILYKDSVQADALIEVNAALAEFTSTSILKLGFDVIKDQIIKLCKIDTVYKVDTGLFEDIIVDVTEYAFCTGFTVIVTGTNEG